MRQTYFDQIPLEEALKSVARAKKPSSHVVQQTKERIAKSKKLQETYNELLRTFDGLLREFRHRRISPRVPW